MKLRLFFYRVKQFFRKRRLKSRKEVDQMDRDISERLDHLTTMRETDGDGGFAATQGSNIQKYKHNHP